MYLYKPIRYRLEITYLQQNYKDDMQTHNEKYPKIDLSKASTTLGMPMPQYSAVFYRGMYLVIYFWPLQIFFLRACVDCRIVLLYITFSHPLFLSIYVGLRLSPSYIIIIHVWDDSIWSRRFIWHIFSCRELWATYFLSTFSKSLIQSTSITMGILFFPPLLLAQFPSNAWVHLVGNTSDILLRELYSLYAQ